MPSWTLRSSSPDCASRYGGSRANCVPIDGSHLAGFVDGTYGAFDANKCFITDTTYTVGAECRYLKHYGNGVITYQTGGLYQYTDSQSSRHQYQRGDVNYVVGGGGGYGVGHSQGVASADGSTMDMFVLRAGGQSLSGPGGSAGSLGNGNGGNNGPHHDWYEHRGGIYKFGYYNCSRIVQGGAVDDYQYHYFCSDGLDLYAGCVASCGTAMADYSSFNFTSAMFGEVTETSTSQVFS